MVKVFVTHTPDALSKYYGQEALSNLRALASVSINKSSVPLSPTNLINLAENCHIIVADRNTTAPEEVFRALPRLCALVRVAVDISNIDVVIASEKGILVTRASAGFAVSVAELIFGYIIDLSRGISYATNSYWKKILPNALMGQQLSNKTLGIIGYGTIGKKVSDFGKFFEMRIVVHDPYVEIDRLDVEQTTLREVLTSSDYVVCLAAATAGTENLLNGRAFELMAPHAFFINVARGSIVDEDALEFALRTGQIAGAAMDVGRAPDQMPSPSIATLPNVIATPHIGGLTPEAVSHQALETVHQIADIIEGKIPAGAVNEKYAHRLQFFSKSQR